MPAMQICPLWKVHTCAAPRSAASRSASAKTICGDLPPSSISVRFSAARRGFLDAQSHGGRAGERDHVDVGRRDERLADGRTLAADEVDDAGRQHLVHDAAERRHAQRIDRRRLHHHRVAADERRAELARAVRHREVVRRDAGDDADRLAHRDAEARCRPVPSRGGTGVSGSCAASSAYFASRSATAPTCCDSATGRSDAGLGDGEVHQPRRRLAEARRRVAQARAALGARTCAARARARTPRARRARPRAPGPPRPPARARRPPPSPGRSPGRCRRPPAPTGRRSARR